MIPTFKPSILRKDMDAVLTCMVEELFENGNIAVEFEKKLTKELDLFSMTGLKEYQRGFEVLLNTYLPEPGMRVALSPLSPWWIHEVLTSRGHVPVYLDVDPDRCTLAAMPPGEIESKADLLFIYHHLGYETSLEPFEELDIPVLEDISEILAQRLSSENPVNGRAGLFHLQEKGYLAGFGSTFLYLRDRKDAGLVKKHKAALDANQHITDIQASIGASQLSRLDKYCTRRCEIRNIFLASLLKTKNKTFAVDEESGHVPFSFPVILNSGSKEVFQYARKKKILSSPAFENSIIDRYPDEVGECPGARGLLLRCVLFPLYPSLSSSDTNLISKVLSTLP